jgi:DNA-binding MurR/RpiR family transcriptional regulator
MSQDTIQLARLAKAHSIPILAITDSHQSPLAPLAEVSFFCRSQRSFATTSNASSLAMIEALVAAVSLRLPDTVKRAEEFTALAVPFLDMGGLPLKRK